MYYYNSFLNISDTQLFAAGGSTDRHKYYVVAYNTEEDYRARKPNITDKNDMSWEDAGQIQDKLLETGDYFAVSIHAFKDDREVGIIVNPELYSKDNTTMEDGGTIEALPISFDEFVEKSPPLINYFYGDKEKTYKRYWNRYGKDYYSLNGAKKDNPSLKIGMSSAYQNYLYQEYGLHISDPRISEEVKKSKHRFNFYAGGDIKDDTVTAIITTTIEIIKIAEDNGIDASKISFQQFAEKVFDKTNISYGKAYLDMAYRILASSNYQARKIKSNE